MARYKYKGEIGSLPWTVSCPVAECRVIDGIAETNNKILGMELLLSGFELIPEEEPVANEKKANTKKVKE